MTKEEFTEAFRKSKFTFSPYHIEILFSLVKKYDSMKFQKAIQEINQMESFPKRDKLFEIIESFQDEGEINLNSSKSVFENEWYIINRAKSVWETSFLIKKNFWIKHGNPAGVK